MELNNCEEQFHEKWNDGVLTFPKGKSKKDLEYEDGRPPIKLPTDIEGKDPIELLGCVGAQ